MRLDFDIDAFLRTPLVARVATAGPTIRPVWFLWEDRAFWWLTGPWSSLDRHLRHDPSIAVVIDVCDLSTGEVKQVRGRGNAEVVPYDRDRAYRKLSRYLGPDAGRWDPRFGLDDDGGQTRFVRLVPQRIEALDLSYRAAADSGR